MIQAYIVTGSDRHCDDSHYIFLDPDDARVCAEILTKDALEHYQKSRSDTITLDEETYGPQTYRRYLENCFTISVTPIDAYEKGDTLNLEGL